MTKAELKKAIEEWKQHCETVQAATSVNIIESPAQRLARIARLRSDYAAFVDYYFPHWTINPETGKATPCAKFHIDAANKLKPTETSKPVLSGIVVRLSLPIWTYLSLCG